MSIEGGDALSLVERPGVRPADGTPRAPVVHRVEFRPDPGEYFRIWIVNLALTVATLGIYSAWAKVRKHRYFYGCTSLAGSTFGYHADPLKILKGRIIAAVLIAAYVAANRTSPRLFALVLVLIAIATPWLVVKSRTFALRVTSWRGMRFNFRQDFAGAYRILLGNLVLVGLTLGILWPWFMCERYRFIVDRSRFGEEAFECRARAGRFYKTVFVAAGLTIAGVFIFMFAVGFIVAIVSASGAATHGGKTPMSPATARIVGLAMAGLMYVVALPLLLGYTQARNLSEVFGNTTIGPHRLKCQLSASTLIGIYLTNVLGIIFTLGLFTPWAQIRLARYRLEVLALEVHGSLDDFVAGSGATPPAAAGEEISSFFDLDFGF